MVRAAARLRPRAPLEPHPRSIPPPAPRARRQFHGGSTDDPVPDAHLRRPCTPRPQRPKSRTASTARCWTSSKPSNELLAALVRASGSPPRHARERDAKPQVRDVGWLRPLAMVSVELEHAIRRRSALRAVTVAARCDELTRLLATSPTTGSDFAVRYAWERAQSPS